MHPPATEASNEPERWLVVGLGNPGPEYGDTRHNIGFRIVDALADIWRAEPWTRAHGGRATQATAPGGQTIYLLQPQTYMNLSGESVRPALEARRVAVPQLIVAHDEVDLPFGTLRLKLGGGLGGHRGLISIADHTGDRGFCRVRFGVGRDPDRPHAVADHVLAAFTPSEEEALPALIDRALASIASIVARGITRSMNDYNAAPQRPPAAADETTNPAPTDGPGPTDPPVD